MKTDNANPNSMLCLAVPMEDLKAHLDGELSMPRRFFVGRHLARCASCREEVNGLRQFGAEMRDLETAVPSPHLRQRIMANLPETAPVSAPSVRWKPNATPRYALAGAFSLLLAVGAFAFNSLNKVTTTQSIVSIEADSRALLPLKDDTKPQPTIGSVNQLKVVLPPDELSVQADKIVALQERAREQRERQVWQRWVRQTPELHQMAALRPMPERVTLTLHNADPDNAVEILRQKVTTLGGKLYTVSATPVTASGGFSNATSEHLYAARIPSDRMTAFAEALHETGAMKASAANKLPIATVSTEIDGAKPKVFADKNSPTATAKPKTPAPSKAASVFVLVALRNGD